MLAGAFLEQLPGAGGKKPPLWDNKAPSLVQSRPILTKSGQHRSDLHRNRSHVGPNWSKFAAGAHKMPPARSLQVLSQCPEVTPKMPRRAFLEHMFSVCPTPHPAGSSLASNFRDCVRGVPLAHAAAACVLHHLHLKGSRCRGLLWVFGDTRLGRDFGVTLPGHPESVDRGPLQSVQVRNERRSECGSALGARGPEFGDA